MDERTLGSIAEKMKGGGFGSDEIEEPEQQPRRPAPAVRPKDDKKVTENDFEEIDFDDE